MPKPTRKQSQFSTANNKSNQNPHLSDGQLLFVLDGESSPQEAAQVDVHIASCWSCRARREQIERAIGNVVEYRDCLIQPHLPIPGGRERFVDRLEEFTRTAAQPSLWRRIILRGLRAFESIAQDAIPRHAWTCALILAGFVLFSLHLWQTPKVSASQLLVNAQASEVRAWHNVTRPVIYQKLRIQVGNRSVTRTIYRDPVGTRRVGRLDLAGIDDKTFADVKGFQSEKRDQPNAMKAADAELRQAFLTAHLSWDDPLSASSYSAWYKSLNDKVDDVTVVGKDFITLRTMTSEGPIAEASITVRTNDFHPVEEEVRLQDSRRLEVHELAWEILPMDAINEAIFEPETTPTIPIKRPVSPIPLPAGVTDAELAEAELRARIALHSEKADLGEPIEVDLHKPNSGEAAVVVKGIVRTAERENELLAALQSIPHVELWLQTMEEAQTELAQRSTGEFQEENREFTSAATPQDPSGVGEGVGTPKSESAVIAKAGRSAFEQRLEISFPIAKDRTTFVNETVEVVQNAMAEAWALRRLTNRYTPDVVVELNSGSQQNLELLIRDHVSVLRQDVNEIRLRISPLLPPISMSEVAAESDGSPSIGATEIDWRDTIMNAFSEMQKVNDNGGTLLTGSSETVPDPQSLTRELQQAIEKLDAHLLSLYQQVNGPFLSGTKTN
jgi:hypothetical protein